MKNLSRNYKRILLIAAGLLIVSQLPSWIFGIQTRYGVYKTLASFGLNTRDVNIYMPWTSRAGMFDCAASPEEMTHVVQFLKLKQYPTGEAFLRRNQVSKSYMTGAPDIPEDSDVYQHTHPVLMPIAGGLYLGSVGYSVSKRRIYFGSNERNVSIV